MHTHAYTQILNEINVMRHLYHRNVVLLFEVISDPSEDTIFMVMEVRTHHKIKHMFVLP